MAVGLVFLVLYTIVLVECSNSFVPIFSIGLHVAPRLNLLDPSTRVCVRISRSINVNIPRCHCQAAFIESVKQSMSFSYDTFTDLSTRFAAVIMAVIMVGINFRER